MEHFEKNATNEDPNDLIKPIQFDNPECDAWFYGQDSNGLHFPISFERFEDHARFYRINPHPPDEPQDAPISVCHDDQQQPPRLLEAEVLPSEELMPCPDAKTILENIGGIIGQSIGNEIRSVTASLAAQEPVQAAPPPEQSQAEPKQPAPKPQDLAEKLLQMEHFALYDRQLYIFDPSRGFYVSVDRDETKSIALKCMQEDLRIKGTANQLRERPRLWAGG